VIFKYRKKKEDREKERFRMLPHLNATVGIIRVMRMVGGHWQEEG
jgi:hypothetical protein